MFKRQNRFVRPVWQNITETNCKESVQSKSPAGQDKVTKLNKKIIIFLTVFVAIFRVLRQLYLSFKLYNIEETKLSWSFAITLKKFWLIPFSFAESLSVIERKRLSKRTVPLFEQNGVEKCSNDLFIFVIFEIRMLIFYFLSFWMLQQIIVNVQQAPYWFLGKLSSLFKNCFNQEVMLLHLRGLDWVFLLCVKVRVRVKGEAKAAQGNRGPVLNWAFKWTVKNITIYVL